MKPQLKCKDLRCPVYVEDTDFQGVVYHANYLKYFERARSEFLKEHEISQTKALQANESFIVKKLDLEFYYPALLDDTLIVSSTAILTSKARMHFLQSARNTKNDTLIIKGVVEVCYFDGIKAKPKAFPKNLLALFG
ncbi:YbgC/FadM family acyl-CoA thioesterase [Gammaproteobacteria bacterium]|jgi:acyl-CoA thioester hydrolase|nr:YbgC/FadM family acyl-CoA thioesterase [Gammaproteobacteria bacterium]MDA8925462.1 YbgC/FadM family acyl-CoA thioesterase [Gammaproteobacteria bacterium]MDA9153972.1 YbgC/FadM family acyl-CoA thioesterase [Gammaproteobacteria bacterium]MDA9340872.1 YbgC/FadM family acyl-CoA thioesterase [Gammaproteobacteria bacterium]MDA9371399.1 YbgC/FadM family acyl-CoA thioesterase [Gammaproteobacteria bacterium]|tara:strand:+ start:4466 stop:4876 length:411 start_codon:yes stop_codon:yes gene_type:complete